MKTKPKLLNSNCLQPIIASLIDAALESPTRPGDVVTLDLVRCLERGEASIRAVELIRDLGRDAAIELEALMYFGRGDYESYAQAYEAMDLEIYDEFGAASQVAGKAASAAEYIATGLARLALD